MNGQSQSTIEILLAARNTAQQAFADFSKQITDVTANLLKSAEASKTISDSQATSAASAKYTTDAYGRLHDELGRFVTAADQVGRATDSSGQSIRGWGDIFSNVFHSFEGRVVEAFAIRDALRALENVAKDAITAFPEMISHAMDLGDKLYEMSLKTGASVEGLSSLRYVSSQTGVSLEAMTGAMSKLEVGLGSTGPKADKLQGTLRSLGLDMIQLKNEKPDQAYIDVMSALGEIPNVADRAYLGVQIFGKGFTTTKALANENMGEMIAKAHELGLVMSTETAAAAHAAEVGFKSLQMQWEAVTTHISAAFLPALVGITQTLGGVFSEAMHEANSKLTELGGGGHGLLQTIALAMGTGNQAIEAQTALYDDLKSALISVAQYGVEPALKAFGFLMTEFNAAKVVFGDVIQIVDGTALAFEYLSLGMAKSLNIATLGHGFKDDITRINANIDSLLTTMSKRGDALANDKSAETDWAQWTTKATNEVNEAIVGLSNSHNTAAETIRRYADISRNASGGLSEAVVEDSSKVVKATEASISRTEQLWDQYFAAIDKSAGDTLQVKLDADTRWYDKQRQTLDKSKDANKNYWNELAALTETLSAKLDATRDAFEQKAAAKSEKVTETSQQRTQKLWDDYYLAVQKDANDTLGAQLAGIDKWYDAAYGVLEKSGADNKNYAEELDALNTTYFERRQEARDKESIAEQRDITSAARVWEEYYQLVADDGASSTQVKIDATNKWFENEVSKLKITDKDYADHYNALVALAEEKTAKIIHANDPIWTAWVGLNADMSKTWASMWTKALDGTGSFVEALASPFRQLEQRWLSLMGAMAAGWENQFIGKLTGVNLAGGGAGGSSGGFNMGSLFGGGGSGQTTSYGYDAAGNNSVTTEGGSGGGLSLASIGLGIAGAVAAPLLGKVVDLFKSIGGPSKDELSSRSSLSGFLSPFETKAGDQSSAIGPLLNQLTQVGYSATEAQKTLGALLDAKNPAAYAAALVPITAALKQIADTQTAVTSVQSLVSAYESAGHVIPASMLETINTLKSMPGLTDAEKASLQGLTDSAKPNFQNLEGVAAKYGITLASLGTKFEQGDLNQKFGGVWQDLQDLINAGGDFGSMMASSTTDAAGHVTSLGQTLGGLVNQSKEFGTTIPDNMQPYLAKLVDAGQLTDGAGNKIKSLDGVKFAPSIQTAMDTMNTTLQLLVKTLQGPGSLQDSINQLHGKDVTVNVLANVDPNLLAYNAQSSDPAFMAAGLAARAAHTAWATTGSVGPEPPVPWGFAEGGIVPGVPTGRDTQMVMASPGEMFLNQGEQSVVGRLMALGGAGTGQQTLEAIRGLLGKILDVLGVSGSAGATFHNQVMLDGRVIDDRITRVGQDNLSHGTWRVPQRNITARAF